MSEQEVPASFQQRQIWLAQSSTEAGDVYNETFVLGLRGPLDVASLAQALELVVERHESLRTAFQMRDGELIQLVPGPVPVPPVEIRDLPDLPAADRMDAALAAVRSAVETPFALDTGPLAQWILFRLAEREHILLLSVHHIVCDGLSLGLVLPDVWRCYAAVCQRQPPPAAPAGPSYRDFVLRQRVQQTDGTWAEELAAWRERLSGAPVAQPPAARPRPPVKSFRGERIEYRFGPSASRHLAMLREHALGTLSPPLLAIFGALLYRYTGESDLVVGTASSGRPPGFERTVGLFANLLPIRLHVAGSMTVEECVSAAVDTYADAVDCSAVPFELVVDAAHAVRDPSHPPLVQVVCTVFEEAEPMVGHGGLEIAVLDAPRGRARFDLMVEHVFRAGNAWRALVEYDSALYDRPAIVRLMRHYERLVVAAARDPLATIASLAMLGPDEDLPPGESRVLDRDGNVLPVGATGEVHVLDADGQWTGTGSVARQCSDGSIEVIGSMRRRMRVGHTNFQPEPVEAMLRSHASVDDAAVIPMSGERYVVAIVGDRAAPDDVEAFLRARIPRSLRPDRIVAVPAVIRAPDGEPVPPAAAGPTPSVDEPAGSSVEGLLLAIWRDVLGSDAIGRDDDFFGIGGRSMAAAQVIQRASRALGLELRTRLLFEHPTVTELAGAIAARYPEFRVSDEPVASPAPVVVTRAPVSVAQLQIWLNQQFTLGAAEDFNASFACRLRGDLRVGLLQEAFRRAVRHHPSLGSWLEVADDVPRQRFGAEGLVALQTVDLEQVPEADRSSEALRRAKELVAQPFDTETAPLVRASLMRLGADDHVLVYVMHHLVTDGVSFGIFHRDIERLYADLLRQRSTELEPPAAHYAEYAAWEQQWLSSDDADEARRYWRRQLSGLRELRLPFDHEPRATLSVAAVHRELPPTAAARIRAVCRRLETTTFTAVTAALSAMLGQWSGQSDIIIGTLVANRPLAVFHNVTGCFAGFLPLRMVCEPDMTFAELLMGVRNVVSDAQEHEHLPLSEIVRLSNAPRSFTRMPLFQTTVQWFEAGQTEVTLPGCRAEPWSVAPPVSRFELTLFAAESARGLTLDLEYATDLWEFETMRRRLDRVVDALVRGTREPNTRLSMLFSSSAASSPSSL